MSKIDDLVEALLSEAESLAAKAVVDKMVEDTSEAWSHLKGLRGKRDAAALILFLLQEAMLDGAITCGAFKNDAGDMEGCKVSFDDGSMLINHGLGVTLESVG